MELKTTIPIHQPGFKINHNHHILLVGSCFSNEIGRKLEENGFQTFINPLGTQFNPISISETINIILRNTPFNASDFFENNGIWNNYKTHSSFSGENLDQVIKNLNSQVNAAHEFICKTDVVILTLGTAWAYELISTQEIVSSCHKMPAKHFNKRKLGVNEIIADFSHLIEHLRNLNPAIKIIFTISPVKHLKDGFVENNWSKSTLNIAVHEILRRFECCDYYPAYEIQTDDLRDYRFYKPDMVHPNETAVNYIFEHFTNSYLSDETKKIAADFYELHLSAEHKVFNRNSSEYTKFIQKIKEKANQLRHVNNNKIEEIIQKIS